jgi:hypothetical protein
MLLNMANVHGLLHNFIQLSIAVISLNVYGSKTDLKSADLNRSWGFKSPSGHHIKSRFVPPAISWVVRARGISPLFTSRIQTGRRL